jgi:uncharacterized protein
MDSFTTGWRFPLSIDTRGGIALTSDEENIEQSVRVILSTAPGERVMRPEFGCDVHSLVFAPNSPSTAGLVDFHVREALGRWEPRIEVEQTSVQSDPERDGVMLIHVRYRVRHSGEARGLVYSFQRIPEGR